MKIAVTSDLHGNLPNIEPCDVLLICGDICPATNHSMKFQEQWLKNEFYNWVESLEVEKVFFIGGNHDFVLERASLSARHRADLLPIGCKAKYISSNEEIIESEFGPIKIFGTPYCKMFGNWAFMKEDSLLKDYFSMIPEGVDILMTHDAPRISDLGCIKEEGFVFYGKNAGNDILAQEILIKKPRFVFCGHIHSGNHDLQTIGETTFANVSLCNEKYQPINNILYLEYGV